jgi:S1-C subfamily serine protease
MIVTNDHVVGAFRSVDVAGVESPTVPTAAVTSSQNADIAVVRTEGLGAAPLSLAAHDPEPGAVVTIGGFPHDPMRGELPGGLMVEPAHVVDYVDGQPMGQPGAVMRLDVPVGQGMSGGAVLDSRGDLAGVLFAVQRPTNEALALPASLVRTALSPPASVPLVTKRC